MPAPFITKRRVEFCETDAAGIAHFSVFFTYMEQAEHELLRHCGTSVILHSGGETVSWPRVAAECEYQGAVRFEDMLDIAVTIERIGRTSVAYAFAFTYAGRAVATGRITAVHCRLATGKPPEPIAIPEALGARLAEFAVAASN